MIEIAILDDQPDYLTAFKTFFNENHNRFHCVVAAENSLAFFEKLAQLDAANLRFALIDIALVGESGLDLVSKLYRAYPNVEILMLTAIEDTDALLKAFGSGAVGYLLKNQSFDEIADYLNIAAMGGAAISPQMARKLIGYFRPREFKRGKLGSRTLQVLHFLAEGWSYKMIADKMGISVDGVRFHIKEIYRALNVQSKAQAIRKYLDNDY